MTDSTTRTYSVDDSSDEVVYAPSTERDWCSERIHGYLCSLPKGHGGPQHVAANSMRVVGVSDRDTSGDTPASPTWQVGDVVHTRGYGVDIGVVVGVETRMVAGEARVHVVGRVHFDSTQLVHRRYPASDLARYTGSAAAPTLPEIGETLIRTYESVGMPREEPEPAPATDVAVRSLQQQLDASRAELERWKVDVREKAITYAKRHDWCSVVDQALVEMGLPPMRRKWDVEVVVTARQTVTITVEDDGDGGEDWAREQVDTYQVRDAASSYDWNIESDDWEIEDVSESTDY